MLRERDENIGFDCARRSFPGTGFEFTSYLNLPYAKYEALIATIFF